MAMRDLVSGGAACAADGSSSSSSNPLGALANALIGSSSKTKERLEEIPQAAPVTSSGRIFHPEVNEPLSNLPGSELDRPMFQPGSQGSEFIGAFRSADQNRFANAWDEIQHSQVTALPREVELQHAYDSGAAMQLPPTSDGPPQRVLSNFLHSFVESSRGGMPFRPVPLPMLGLSQGDKQCIRDRSSIMARHFFADKSEDFINAQVNTLLSSLDIDSDAHANRHLPSRLREMEDYWNESQGIMKPAPHVTDGWVAEYSQHRTQHGDPDAWAHSFEQQHGINGWASEFEQEQSQLTSLGHMRGVNVSNLAAMEQTRMLASTLSQNNDPKFQNSKFLQFVSKMSRGELIIDDDQVKQASSGDWASEYQQQYNPSSTWADEYNSQVPDQWAKEFASDRYQHGQVDDQWINEFSNLNVSDEWAEEFGNQIGQSLNGEYADNWANDYDEFGELLPFFLSLLSEQSFKP